MSQSVKSLCLLVLAVMLASAVPAAASHATMPHSFGNLPLTFEVNEGQVDPSVRFLSRAQKSTIFLTPREAVLSLRGAGDQRAVVRWEMAGGNRNPRIVGERPVA